MNTDSLRRLLSMQFARRNADDGGFHRESARAVLRMIREREANAR